MSAIHNLCIDCGALISMGEMLCGGCAAASARGAADAVDPTAAAPLPDDGEQLHMASCALTARDYSLIERFLAERAGRDPWVAALARAKLGAARIAAVGPEVATLNSRLSFAIDGGTRQQRTLVHWDHDIVPGTTLAVATPLGLGLLGMRVGERGILHGRDGIRRELLLAAIQYQPEAARAGDPARGGMSGRREPPAAFDAPDQAAGAADIIPLRPRRPRGPDKDWPPGPGSPGPSAA